MYVKWRNKMSELIKTVKLNKTYGKGESAVVAVNDIDLTINKGEFTAIVGTSGSGKSTLMHLLGGVDDPTSGKVLIEGEDIFALKDEKRSIFRRRKIGFIFQEYNLIPILTVEENIVMPILLDGNKVDKNEVEELLERLGLADRRNHLPSQLSGGQQQRVAIGRAIVNRPTLILADEPTGNLDKRNSEEVINIMFEAVRDRKETLVIVTHEMDIVAMADRIIHLEDGKIVSDTMQTK